MVQHWRRPFPHASHRPGDANTGPELTSWKAIAAYLGVSVRTAQKWEIDKRLPVRRLPGGRARVSADVAELAQWKEEILIGPSIWNSLRFIRYYAGVATVVLVGLLATGAWYVSYGPGTNPPAQFWVKGRSLVVLDQYGRELWSKTFDAPLFRDAYIHNESGMNSMIWFGNIDDDPQVETLFAYHPEDRDTSGTVLICLSARGREKWRFVPGKPVADRTRSYSDAFIIERFSVVRSESDHRQRIFVTSQFAKGHPNQFAMLATNGAVLGEYWHSGHLPQLQVRALPQGGERILLGGVNDGYQSAVLIALDSRSLGGSSRQAANDPLQLLGFAPAKEEAFVLFPRTCINRSMETSNEVVSFQDDDKSINVRVQEKSGCDCYVDYTLDESFRVKEVRFSGELELLHRTFEAENHLGPDHYRQELARLQATPNRASLPHPVTSSSAQAGSTM